MQAMNIGQAASASGVSAKMIRHYEEIGLIPKVGRTAAGYRVYAEQDLHVLAFIKQARNLGFSIEQIRELLNLWHNKRRSSRKVKELAVNHIQQLDERIKELQAMRRVIAELAEHCHGDDRPECPILNELVEGNQHQYVENQNKNNARHLTETSRRRK